MKYVNFAYVFLEVILKDFSVGGATARIFTVEPAPPGC